MRTTGSVFWGGGAWVSQSLPRLPFTKSSIQCVFHFHHPSQTEWTVFCFQQHWSASELLGLGILEGKWSARPEENGSPLGGFDWLPLGEDLLRGLCWYTQCSRKDRSYVFVQCWRTGVTKGQQEKVGCLAHSVWDAKLLVCFLFWVEWKDALCFIFEARAPAWKGKTLQ